MSSRYILRKLMHALVTILAIVILNFVLFRLMPGSPERQTRNPNLRPEVIAANRERWGLDKPIPEQLVLYLKSTFTGDLGYSIKYRGQPVGEVVLNAAGPTVLLIGTGEVDRDRRAGSGSARDRAGGAAAPWTGWGTGSASSSTRCPTS